MSTTPGIKVGARQFTDLVYADDTTFFFPSASDAAECLSSFNSSSSVLGMRVLWAKTKLQNIGWFWCTRSSIKHHGGWKYRAWSEWTTSYTSAALSPPTAAVKLI